MSDNECLRKESNKFDWLDISADKLDAAIMNNEINFKNITAEQLEALIKNDRLDGWINFYGIASDSPDGFFASDALTNSLMEKLYKEYLVSEEDNPPLSSKEWQRIILINGGISKEIAELFVSEWIEGNEYNEFMNKLNKSE